MLKLKSALVWLFFIALHAELSGAEFLYYAAGEKITVQEIQLSGDLQKVQQVEHPGLHRFTFAPNKKFLYAQAKMIDNPDCISIATYRIGSDGRLTYLYNAPISSKMADLKVDATGSFLVGANYKTGVVSVWLLANGFFKGQLADQLTLEKKIHSVCFSPDNKFLLLPATGPDKVFQLNFDATTGKLQKQASAKGLATGARQPRHLIFHRRLNIAYTTQERENPGAAVWEWSKQQKGLQFVQSLVSDKDQSGRITTATLKLSPDNRFLYVSCRDKNGVHDAVLLYKVNSKTGLLTYIDRFSCGHLPVSLALSHTGDFLYVGASKGKSLEVFKVDKVSGRLLKKRTISIDSGAACIEVLTM